MSSSFGQLFVVTTFGESHGPAVGGVVDGMPPGIPVEVAEIQRELDRRRPGQGALAKAALAAAAGVTVRGGTVQVGTVKAERRDWDEVEKNPVRCPDAQAAARMAEEIAAAREQKDSLGGVVEVVARGVPAGWGDPTMAKLDALLGAAMLSIPATKGVEIGGGFALAELHGSQSNDVFDGVKHLTNFAGGIS